MKKITLITNYLLLITSANISFAASYPNSCPSEAQVIVKAVGGCSAVDKDAYVAVYEQCCAVSSASPSSTTVLWIIAVIAVLGLAAAGVWYYLRARKTEKTN